MVNFSSRIDNTKYLSLYNSYKICHFQRSIWSKFWRKPRGTHTSFERYDSAHVNKQKKIGGHVVYKKINFS